jgi:hypothetical protein
VHLPIPVLTSRPALRLSASSAVLLALLVALIVCWVNSKDPSYLWLEGQQRVEMVRTGMSFSVMLAAYRRTVVDPPIVDDLEWREKLLKRLLTANDNRLIALDPGMISHR